MMSVYSGPPPQHKPDRHVAHAGGDDATPRAVRLLVHTDPHWMTPPQLRYISPGRWLARPTYDQLERGVVKRLDRRVLEVIVYAFDNTRLRTIVELVHAATGIATATSTFSLRVLLFDPELNSLNPRRWSGTVMNIERLPQQSLRDVLGGKAELVLAGGRGDVRRASQGRDARDARDTRDPGDMTLGSLSLYDGELVECRVTAPARAPPDVGDAPWSREGE